MSLETKPEIDDIGIKDVACNTLADHLGIDPSKIAKETIDLSDSSERLTLVRKLLNIFGLPIIPCYKKLADSLEPCKTIDEIVSVIRGLLKAHKLPV